MKVTTYEATVENGQIKLPAEARLPEHARVYVVVPEIEETHRVRVMSPRLGDPRRAVDFVMDVTPELPDAGV
jgi:hypothetical protein